MPKSYEDEIRDILKGMDRFPGEGRPPGGQRRWTSPGFGGVRRGRLGQLDAQRVMGGALILMLFTWIVQGPWSGNYPWLLAAAGYVSLASLALFVIALVMLIRGGRFAGGGLYREQRWREQVIDLPRRGAPLQSWRYALRRFLSRFGRRGSGGRSGPRGRDSYQW